MRRVILSLVAALVVAAFAAPVAAAKPQIQKESINEVALDDFLTPACGFEVWNTFTGHVMSRVTFDAEGNFVRDIFTIAVRGTMNAGGATVRFR
jgi:hypothetical protein